MAIAVRIIPPAGVGVNAKNSTAQLLLRLRMTSPGGATIHREKSSDVRDGSVLSLCDNSDNRRN
jgi:hypothetical protein